MTGAFRRAGFFAEIERNVRETAAFCPAIRSLDSLSLRACGAALEVRFTVRLHTERVREVTTYVSSEILDEIARQYAGKLSKDHRFPDL